MEIILSPGKKIYFASDFHLGAAADRGSKQRERKVVEWLDHIAKDAEHVFLVGDLFDFWYEYKTVVPKGFLLFFYKVMDLRERGIAVTFFTGNHDIWMFSYFQDELGVEVYREPLSLNVVGQARFLVGHGDGLGPGDHFYKLLKKIFTNSLCQWLFTYLPPRMGIGFANWWSGKSRKKGVKNLAKDFDPSKEWIMSYCREIDLEQPFHYYVFGHRHIPIHQPIGQFGRYVNLGEWMNQCTYAVYDGETLALKQWPSQETLPYPTPKATSRMPPTN